MVNKTVYNKDSKGKIRFVTIQSEGDTMIQISGIVGTPNPVTNAKNIKGKNIGKSNETTPEEQCIKECEAKIKDKLASGYFETEEEAVNSFVVLPMLANSFKERYDKGKVDFSKSDYYIQPKLDGMRCLTFIKDGEVKLISRDNRDITHSVPHIVAELKNKLGHLNIILDGELYCHGLTFQQVMTRLKKYRQGETEEIIYTMYDTVDTISDYKERYILLSGLKNDFKLETCDVVTFAQVDSLEKINDMTAFYVGQGYEGSMIRRNVGGYAIDKRTDALLKYKSFIDIQLPILDIVPGDADPTQGYPIYAWPGAKDDILKSGLRMSVKEKREFLTNKDEYLCKMAELRFFEYTDAGVPRFPVTVGIRLDK